jgi:hypothetical protein
MKVLTVIIFSLICLTNYGQETNSEFDGQNWEAPYTLSVPRDWSIERFLIPIGFAPQIQYKGVEDIRFSPGWAKVNTDDYWSYAFLWYLDGDIKIDSDIIADNLKTYYTGLITINGSKIPGEKIKPVEVTIKEVATDTFDSRSFLGTIRMLDYMAQKPITLNCKIHLKSCNGKSNTIIFYELSPMQLSHNIWLSLDKLWDDFKCKRN